MRRGGRGRGGPGLMGTMARTAVVAGTATVVSKGVSGAMDSAAQQRAAAEQQRAAAEQQRFDSAVEQAVAQQLAAQQPTAAQEAAPPPAAAAQEVAPPPAAGAADRITMLQQLAQLKSQGILTDAEFEAEKARILAS